MVHGCKPLETADTTAAQTND